MSDLRHGPEAETVRQIAAGHGIAVDAATCERIAGQAAAQLRHLRRLTELLSLDDDVHAFRRRLELEARRG